MAGRSIGVNKVLMCWVIGLHCNNGIDSDSDDNEPKRRYQGVKLSVFHTR